MDLLQLVNMIVQHDPAGENPGIPRASSCPGLNFTQKPRWWTPRGRGITYATLCDECYRKYSREDDFTAVSTMNSCFCDGFLYGNRLGRQGNVNVSFWNKDMRKFYPITHAGVEIPDEHGFYVAIHVNLESGYAFKYELLINGRVVVPYSDDYHYNLAVASNNDHHAFALKKFHMVSGSEHSMSRWKMFPAEFLLHRGIILSGSSITVNIRVYKMVEKRFYDSTGTFVGEYVYDNGLCVVRDTEENAHMSRLRTGHLAYTVSKMPFKEMEEVKELNAALTMIGTGAGERGGCSGLLSECISSYRDAVMKRINYLQMVNGRDGDAEIERLRAAVAVFSEKRERENSDDSYLD